MSTDKKKFKDTGFGKFINKAKDFLPELAGVGFSVASGNFVGAIGEVKNMIKKKAVNDEKAKELLIEFEKLENEFSLEMYELEIKDRDSARNREIELSKSGGVDWLMYATGLTGLLSFVVVLYAVIFMEVKESAILHQLIGMVEGVAISLFAYYFGTSKGSKDKDEIIKKNY